MHGLEALDWNEILLRIQGLATSEPARERLARTAPLTDETTALESFREINEALQLLSLGARPHLQSLDLFNSWIPRLKKNAVLKNLEIKDVRHFCLEAIALTEVLKGLETAWGTDLLHRLMDASEPLSAIDQILTPGGEIRSDASERLHRLHGEKERLGREVHGILDRFVKDHEYENFLQDKYVTTREGRWVLPVRGGMQHHLPGVIHGTSQTKQTVFMEPEKVIPLNNRLRQVDVEIEDEIERLLKELSSYLTMRVSEFESSRQAMEDADTRFAQAQFSSQIDARPVEFSDGALALIDVRHPLLSIGGKKVVPNTVHLDVAKGLLLLSGPNAGGKTILLKSVGLAAQMARCGLPVAAADGSRLPFFENILAGIGDAQSVDEDLSTFAAHLRVLHRATELRGPRSLVLVDEICGSTDPEEGSALARSFIETYAENGVFAVITSHLGPLKTGWPEGGRIVNGSLEYDSRTGRPTYQFISGIPGDSLALQTAKRVGVPEQILNRALEFLAPATRARLQGLDEVERLKSDILLLQESLRKETQEAHRQRRKLDEQVARFQAEKDAWLAKTVRKAERKVEEAIQQAKVEDVFKRHRQLQDIKFQLPELVKAKPIDSGQMADSSESFARTFPPGSKVFVPSLGQDAVVQSAPNSKGEVMVLSGSVRLQLPWRELKAARRPANPTGDLVRRSGTVTVIRPDEDRTLDLRGKTVDEALEDLELELDRAVERKEDRLKIIHGHGTEALKRAVRTHLSRSVYVKKWKAGTPESGGDGVTWVELAE